MARSDRTRSQTPEPHYWIAFLLLLCFGIASALIYGIGDAIALQIGGLLFVCLGTPMAALLAFAFKRCTRVLAITLMAGGAILTGLRQVDSLPNPVVYLPMVMLGLGAVALAAACLRWETARTRPICLRCGYSKEGLEGIESCPECGERLPWNLYRPIRDDAD
ncbi:MAG: hypothetical protein KIT24_10660 [Phycisphaeraceae bacterium]|nr:hypothetical protein [Phycisphaeraceae bacterium]